MVSMHNSKSSLTNLASSHCVILPNNTVPTSMDKNIEKTFYATNNSKKNNFNVKEHSINDRIKKFHVQNRSLNQSSLNSNLGLNILKTKFN